MAVEASGIARGALARQEVGKGQGVPQALTFLSSWLWCAGLKCRGASC
jgi:hypothetical protein